MFAVAASPPPDPPVADPSMATLFSLYQPYLVNFSPYEPVYFLVGTEPEKSKFQVSFKYRLFNPAGSLVKDHAWLQGLHFGYTQTSFWDLASDSAPFEDTSYKPELFFVSSNIKTRPAWMKGFFLQTGLQHESNGRGGNLSRSTNFAYVKPSFIFYDPNSRYGLQIAPKIWTYIHNEDDTNPDLYAYRGYFELDVKVGKANSLVLGSYFRWADRGRLPAAGPVLPDSPPVKRQPGPVFPRPVRKCPGRKPPRLHGAQPVPAAGLFAGKINPVRR